MALLSIISKPEGSGGYISYSYHLARALSSDLHLVYVENPDNYPLGTPNTTGEATVHLHRQLEKSTEEAYRVISRQVEETIDRSVEDPAIDITTDIDSEKVVIRRMTGENDIQLLVLENQGMDGFWSGNVRTREIIRDAECPVWIVPPDPVFQEPDNIVYATDYTEHDVNTLVRLVQMLGSFSPTITALHITENVDFELKIKEAGFQKMLQADTGYGRINVNALTGNGGDTSRLINGYAVGIGANLLVVLKENRTFLERIFKSSETNRIVKHAAIPVLVFHEQ
ncbi:MAG: hypothetical protein EHM46_02165 [Bacteroidetes bacterium]|nr:MAG: hypothetical protein EHM46_02165 [Bacteroidota bacterium]